MKAIGLSVLAVGVIGVLATLTMDTSVAFGSMRINNVGLMADKQNLLLIFSAMAIVGAIFAALGGNSPSAELAPDEAQRAQYMPDLHEQPDAKSNERFWSEALAEFEGESRRPELWAKLFAEANGNDAAAKAAYLKTRVAQLENEPPAFIFELRSKGYKVEFIKSRWHMVSPSGGLTSYFSSLAALERGAKYELNRPSKT